MKKSIMIQNLKDKGIDIPENLKWIEFQKFYKKNINSINSNIDEKKLKTYYTENNKLMKLRDKLYPDIISLMKKMKNETKPNQNLINQMFNLYNQFYLRRDNPDSGANISRVFQTFKKLTKGHI